ncbi:hypothetical protein A3762_12855 [Oleiphilus sp. HI0125]|uniref:hypothetical protein n=1 Tax=Oleiphilus sp. HI0125 TaxID=1822266 RepID=UPI0007C2D6B2|nr:hypothetical protein [Oleiphilus sp. HI0125]KZZ63012.1 hypothetical protein A3762_12855 [Oleiphilus sp. HI0125]
MSRLARAFLYSLTALVVGCGEFIVDDQDFSDNRRTLDITNDNAEAYLWSSYQSIFSPLYFARLNEMLDARDFKGVQVGGYTCPGGGSAVVNFPNASGVRYEESDAFSINYTACFNDAGAQLNGEVSGKYKETEGYNKTFATDLTVAQCITNLELDEKIDAGRYELIDDQASNLIFDKQGARLFVRYMEQDPQDDQLAIEKRVEELSLDQIAVVVNRSTTDFDSSFEEDGARIFVVEDGLQEQIDCAYYEREIDLDLQDLIVDIDDNTYELSGKLALKNSMGREVGVSSRQDRVYSLSGDFTSVLSKGNFREDHSIKDFEWRIEYGPTSQSTWALSFSAELTNQNDGVIFEAFSSTGSPLRGAFDLSVPNLGILSVSGKDDDGVAMNVLNSAGVTFAIQSDGDINGDGRVDLTAPNFNVAWNDFLDRNFVRPPVENIIR